MRDSAIFYRSWKQAVDRLGDGERGCIYEIILDYALDGKEPDTDDPVALLVFDMVKVQIDVNNQRYENGKKGGRPKGKANNNLDNTKEKRNENLNKTKLKPNVNVNDNDNVNDNANKRVEKQQEMFDRLIIGRAVTKELQEVLREWIQYKAEKQQPYRETGMRSLITQAVNKSAQEGADVVVSVIRSSMASGYKGITWDRAKRPIPKWNNSPARSYDMQDLERKLLATN